MTRKLLKKIAVKTVVDARDSPQQLARLIQFINFSVKVLDCVKCFKTWKAICIAFENKWKFEKSPAICPFFCIFDAIYFQIKRILIIELET